MQRSTLGNQHSAELNPIAAGVTPGIAGGTTLGNAPGSSPVSAAVIKVAASAPAANRMVAKLVPLWRMSGPPPAVLEPEPLGRSTVMP